MNTKIDWQAYLDGSLTEEQYQTAEQILESSPEARKELEGLKSLKTQLKDLAKRETIPQASLNQTLKQVVKTNRRPFFSNPRILAPLAVGTCAIAAALIFAPQVPITANANTIDLRKSPIVASTHIHNPESAAQWVVTNLKDSAPVVSLSSLSGAEFTGADCGHCWLAYRFKYQGDTYTIYGRHEDNPFANFPSERINGKTFYKLSDGIGWRCKDDMTYVVKGGNTKAQTKIATTACQETPNLLPSN